MMQNLCVVSDYWFPSSVKHMLIFACVKPSNSRFNTLQADMLSLQFYLLVLCARQNEEQIIIMVIWYALVTTGVLRGFSLWAWGYVGIVNSHELCMIWSLYSISVAMINGIVNIFIMIVCCSSKLLMQEQSCFVVKVGLHNGNGKSTIITENLEL